MANFDISFSYVLSNEGGLEQNPNDTGGTTRYGISDAYLILRKDSRKAQDLSLDDAREIYLSDFWKFDAVESQILANKLLDMLVNLGYGAAIRLVQRALAIPQDGILGPETLRLLNAANPDTLLLEIKARLCEFYARTVLKNPSDVTFLLGWLRRAVKP